jgi:hypothetical protein
MATPETFLIERRVWCYGTHGDARALPCREAGSGTARHMVTPEPFRAGMWGLALWDTW